jgi:phage terminase large subunit GpA-like protein
MPLSNAAADVSSKRARLFAVAARCSWTARKQTPDVWAAANRIYGPSTGVPGARDPRLTPYIIPFVRAFDDPRYRRVVLVTAAQSGKTEALLDLMGERLDNRPVPVMYVGPSKEFITDQFEPRLVELFQQSASLAGKVLGGLESKRQKKTLKRVAGVRVRLAHAGSSTALKSDPAALALVDEYDELLRDVKRQGDPLGLVEARGATYADFVTGVTSTPSKGSIDVRTDDGSNLEFWKPAPVEHLESPIWKLFQEGTMHHWCWPCVHCGQYFVPRFSHLKWVQPSEGSKVSPAEVRRTAHVECPHCKGNLEERHKASMNTRGVYVAPGQEVDTGGNVTGDPPETSTISFWVSGLCSPFVSFGQRAEDYLKAVRLADPERIRTAINAGFGELFAGGGGDAPEWAEVAEHRGEYGRGELPDGVIHMVLTVDVQINRLVYVIRGWGGRATSWLIDWGLLYGETVEPPVWNDLADLVQTPVCGLPLRLALIDSGFRPGKRIELPLNRVYEFCRRFPRLVRPTKGSSSSMRVPLIVSKIEVTPNGKTAKYGLDLLRLDTDHWKSWVHERVRWPVDQPGAWHLPHDVTDDYCAQIVSEARMRLPSGRVQWVQRARENHILDCEAMQAAASHLLNAQRIREGARRAAVPRPVPPTPSAETGGVSWIGQAGPRGAWIEPRRDWFGRGWR